MSLTVLIGGARSGKSAAAVRLATAANAPVTFIATAEARDAEMATRIGRHRRERPSAWATVEAPIMLTDAVAAAPPGDSVIIDCLTLWVSNMIEADRGDDDVMAAADAFAGASVARPGSTFVVTNEVGAGLVPMEPLSRRYRDLLGLVNASVVASAERAYFMVAGRALALEVLVR
jgi:adenosylcobinamide kinase / adenosylcobinamide-phosphate guanylyltransferase